MNKDNITTAPFLVRPFEVKSIKEDGENFIVEGFASVYGNIDSYGEIVEAGAFTEDLAKNGNERPILWMHMSDEPIGKGFFTDMPTGLFVKIILPKSDDFVAKRVMPQIKIGSVKGLSIGYWTLEETYDRENDLVRLQKLKLRETSTVTFAANELAQITAAKQYIAQFEKAQTKTPQYQSKTKHLPLMSKDTEWHTKKAIKDIKANTNSIDKPTEQYSKGFLYCDPSKKDSFDGYNLPFTYYDEGEFKAVPEAIIKTVPSLFGKTSSKLTPELKEQLKEQVNYYYKEMDMEPPFNSGYICIDKVTLSHFKKQDIHKIFERDVILTSQAKQYIADKLCKAEKPPQSEKKSELLSEFRLLSDQLNGG